MLVHQSIQDPLFLAYTIHLLRCLLSNTDGNAKVDLRSYLLYLARPAKNASLGKEKLSRGMDFCPEEPDSRHARDCLTLP